MLECLVIPGEAFVRSDAARRALGACRSGQFGHKADLCHEAP